MLTSLTILTTQACHGPEKNPELKDPVYLEVVKEKDTLSTQVVSQKNEVNKDREIYDNAPIRTGQRQDAADDYFEAKNKLDKMIEKFRYLSISAESRLKEDRLAYNKAFEEGKPWPNPEEYQFFSLEKKLRDAPREWSPENRIQKRAPAAAPKTESESE